MSLDLKSTSRLKPHNSLLHKDGTTREINLAAIKTDLDRYKVTKKMLLLAMLLQEHCKSLIRFHDQLKRKLRLVQDEISDLIIISDSRLLLTKVYQPIHYSNLYNEANNVSA